jgi:hypothetical protein
MTPARTPGNLLASLHRRRTRKRTVTDFIMLAIFVLMFGGLGVMLIVVGTRTTDELGASHLAMLTGEAGGSIPRVDLKLGPAAASAVAI